MPNPFKDWARMYGAHQQYLDSQGRRSSFLGQLAGIPNRMHEAADATELGMTMLRHADLANGRGLPATVTVEGVWQIGTYLNTSPVDGVVADNHAARTQPGRRLAVFVDPHQPFDITIDWIRTAQL